MSNTENTENTENTATDAAAAEGGDESGTTPVERQLERMGKILKLSGNVRDFAAKVPNVPSQAWGGELRDAIEQLEAAAAECVTALEAAPTDYTHPRTGGRAPIGVGDRVQISPPFRDDFKSLLGDVEFGATAIGEVKNIDDKSRAVVWWDGGKVRQLVTTRKLSHAGAAGEVAS